MEIEVYDVLRVRTFGSYAFIDSRSTHRMIDLHSRDICIYLGQGYHLDHVFLTPYGILGWNGKFKDILCVLERVDRV